MGSLCIEQLPVLAAGSLAGGFLRLHFGPRSSIAAAYLALWAICSAKCRLAFFALRRAYLDWVSSSEDAVFDKFLITRRSTNPVTGPIMVTRSPRATCPLSCPFRKRGSGPPAGICYAEHGALGGYVWTLLDRTAPGRTIMNEVRVYDFAELLFAIRPLAPAEMWRHNVAGDLPSIDRATIDENALRHLIDANRGRRGFTFTHYDVRTNLKNRAAVKVANENGFTINLSGNSLQHADELADLGIAPVTTILPSNVRENQRTPKKGRTVVICPTFTHAGVTCASCGLCARQRSTVVGLPAIGGRKHTIV